MKPQRLALITGMLLVLVLFLAPVSATDSDSSNSAGYITVGLQPVAAFVVYYPSNAIPLTATFRDQSTGSTPLTYHWDFGDGSSSSEQNPKHTYITSGPYTVTLTVTNSYGSDTITKKDVISPGLGPRADFTVAPSSGTVPLPVLFTDASSGNPTSWLWEFGDATTSDQQNPVHVYSAGSKYSVTLTVSNDYGSSTVTKSGVVTAIKSLNASFIADPATGRVPLTVRFTDTSIGTPTSWKWNFGDGSTSKDQNPVHIFSSNGVYMVSLTVTNAAENDTTTQNINAGGVPVADFSADKTQAAINENIQFTDLSTNSPTQWLWDFGDGVTVSSQNPVHQYLAKGIYTVTLTAANDNGKNSITKKNYIDIGLAPIADFISDSQTVGIPGNVQFIDRSTQYPTSWLWDFGDGATSTEESPSHLYKTAGSYTVSLTVKNNAGSNTKVVQNYINAGLGPRVDFSASPLNGQTGTFIKFTDLSTNAPTSWLWEFGDGMTSTDQNPYHQYNRAGTFRVTLTTVNAYSWARVTKNDYINITGPALVATTVTTAAPNLKPVADFTVDQRIGTAPFIVKFKDLSQNSPTRWSWEFGDGGSSTDQNPVHVYQNEGEYNVTLTVSNQYGTDSKHSTGLDQVATVTTVQTTVVSTTAATPVLTTVPATTVPTTKAPLSAVGVIAAVCMTGALVLLARRTR